MIGDLLRFRGIGPGEDLERSSGLSSVGDEKNEFPSGSVVGLNKDDPRPESFDLDGIVYLACGCDDPEPASSPICVS